MKKYGLIGRTLAHSISPEIHSYFGSYTYDKYELPSEEAVASFMRTTPLDGFNVTVPYKQTVFSLCQSLSEKAQKAGAVNTVVRRNGVWYGDNTDVDGFLWLVEKSGQSLQGKKILILGAGGVSKAIAVALSSLHASYHILTHAENTPAGLAPFADTQILINATPVGMYPDNGKTPVDLAFFPRLQFVFDVIANPLRTRLCLEAKERGVPFIGGLPMLVAQAASACECFTGNALAPGTAEEAFRRVSLSSENIVLIGMPGVGKTTVGRTLSALLCKSFSDTDEEVAKTGKTPAQIITEDGEEAFRKAESEAVALCARKTGCVIATGGGVVTKRENYFPLAQNGRIVFLTRPPEELETAGRPLSENGLRALYEKRLALYKSFADVEIKAEKTPGQTAEKIREELNL